MLKMIAMEKRKQKKGEPSILIGLIDEHLPQTRKRKV
jgi:hypothetical protein